MIDGAKGASGPKTLATTPVTSTIDPDPPTTHDQPSTQTHRHTHLRMHCPVNRLPHVRCHIPLPRRLCGPPLPLPSPAQAPAVGLPMWGCKSDLKMDSICQEHASSHQIHTKQRPTSVPSEGGAHIRDTIIIDRYVHAREILFHTRQHQVGEGRPARRGRRAAEGGGGCGCCRRGGRG